MKGFVYVFKQSGTTFYKIGMSETDSVNDRFIQFKTYSPTGCEIISVIETDHARYLEKKLHTQFAEKRMSGEFFNLTDVDIATIKNYESEKIATLNNFFWQYIVGKNLDVDAMKRVLNLMDKSENVSFDKKTELILLEVSKYFNNMSVTNTEIYDKIKVKYPSITKKMLGMILKKKYTSKIVKVGKITKRLYTII